MDQPEDAPSPVHSYSELPARYDEECLRCGATGDLRICAGCRVARYCSAECQRAHWKQHKKSCEDFDTVFAKSQEKLKKAGLVPADTSARDRASIEQSQKKHLKEILSSGGSLKWKMDGHVEEQEWSAIVDMHKEVVDEAMRWG